MRRVPRRRCAQGPLTGEMVMANGAKFSTAHHPVDMGLPMLHLIKAGFDVETVTRAVHA